MHTLTTYSREELDELVREVLPPTAVPPGRPDDRDARATGVCVGGDLVSILDVIFQTAAVATASAAVLLCAFGAGWVLDRVFGGGRR